MVTKQINLNTNFIKTKERLLRLERIPFQSLAL